MKREDFSDVHGPFSSDSYSVLNFRLNIVLDSFSLYKLEFGSYYSWYTIYFANHLHLKKKVVRSIMLCAILTRDRLLPECDVSICVQPLVVIIKLIPLMQTSS